MWNTLLIFCSQSAPQKFYLSVASRLLTLPFTGTDTASQQEFTSCLKDTLKGLAKNADNLQVSGTQRSGFNLSV